MQSEVELDEDIKKFYHITAYPELIIIFYNSNVIFKSHYSIYILKYL